MSARGFALAAVSIAWSAAFAQTPPVEIRIVTPAAGDLVTGASIVRVELSPAERVGDVSRVTLYVDGQTLCAAPSERPQCEWNAGPTVKPHLVRAVAELRGGGRAVATVRTRGLDLAESVSVRVVQVTAAVVDGRNRFVRGLPAAAFRIWEDGAPQEIEHFAAEGGPLDLVLAVDISGSMGSAMPQLKAAVKAFLAALRPEDRVTLLAFNDRIFTVAAHDATPEQRASAIDRLAAWGGTALYDAMLQSLPKLTGAGRRALVVFSDGDDRSSQAARDGVIRPLESSDTTLFVIGLGRRDVLESLEDTLGDLAVRSGGRVLRAGRPGELAGVFGEIRDELANQYLLGYQPSNSRRDGAWREIKVEVDGGRYRVRARQGYRATPQ